MPVRYTPLVYCSFHVVLSKHTADVAVKMLKEKRAFSIRSGVKKKFYSHETRV